MVAERPVDTPLNDTERHGLEARRESVMADVMSLTLLRRLYDYHWWANRRLFEGPCHRGIQTHDTIRLYNTCGGESAW